MELGEKLRRARQEAGLSQREVCGEVITRNMLSLIEHGTAKPSMTTLRYLAGQLGKPVSFFLDEDVTASPNGETMSAARRFYDGGAYAAAAKALEHYRGPDELYDREAALLLALSRLGWAEELLREGRKPYALEILEHTVTKGVYCEAILEGRRLQLLSSLQEVTFPSLDEALLARAKQALRSGNSDRAGQLLDAAEDRTDPEWNLLRGEIWLKQQDYVRAARCLRLAENAYPQVAADLEVCCRELGDYKGAYEYACKQRT